MGASLRRSLVRRAFSLNAWTGKSQRHGHLCSCATSYAARYAASCVAICVANFVLAKCATFRSHPVVFRISHFLFRGFPLLTFLRSFVSGSNFSSQIEKK